jgi:hypothetical protein
MVTFQSALGVEQANVVPSLGMVQANPMQAFSGGLGEGETTATFAKWLAWSTFFLVAGTAVGYAFGVERTLRFARPPRKKSKHY